MTEYLTPAELHLLTGCARAAAMEAWLKKSAIAHRRDGRRIIVSRIHVQDWLSGRTMVSSGLNLSAVR